MKNKYLECGKITNTHGVHGLLKVEPWCDSPGVFASLRRVFTRAGHENYREITVKSASVFKGAVLVSLEGIETFEAAATMKNTVLWCLREDIPLTDGAVFVCDLIGLPVIDADSGRVYGTVEEVIEAPASPVYRINTGEREVLFPDAGEFVKERNPEKGIFIRPIPGFFDD